MEVLHQMLVKNILSLIYLSAVIAYVSTAIRYEEWPVVWRAGTKHFFLILSGMIALVVVIAGLEYGFHW